MNRPTPILISLAGLLTAASAAFAGDLNPPGGPVSSSMKTLDEVEPRVLIDLTAVPLTINQQGSYYLTENLIALSAGQDCITVLADDVTLDLMGFTIGGSQVGFWERGVVIDPSAENVTVRNGTVRDCNQDGISGGPSPLSVSSGMRVIDVRSLRNGGNGILGGPDCSVVRCTTTDNGGEGISAGSGSTIIACTASSNTGGGIFANSGSTVTGCVAKSNGSVGISASSGSTITACSASSNSSTGINASSNSAISACAGSSNTGIGISAGSGSSITGCTASFNSDDGINASSGSTVAVCAARSNVGDGVHVSADCLVRGNTCLNNGIGVGGAGIHATMADNRIEDNLVMHNDRGIDVDAAGNFIVRNSASGNGFDYLIVVGNSTGQILNVAGATITSCNPWANFLF